MEYQVIQNFITFNRSNQKFKPVGIVLHETADPGATAENEQRYFNSGYRAASAHVFIDWDSIVQTIPWEEKAWHAGPTANSRFIGVELCRPAKRDEEKFNEVWNRGVWLFSSLFINVIKEYTITKENLMSHNEVRLRWKETTHTDPDAYFKDYGRTVDDFRTAVQREINKLVIPDNPIFVPVPLEVTANVLNCRKGPAPEYPLLIMDGQEKTFRKGDYLTAVGFENGWWKLNIKGYTGYVIEKYTKKRILQEFSPVELRVTAISLNCRTGPGTEFPVLLVNGEQKVFRIDDYITAIGYENGWWKLNVNGRIGYVTEKFTAKR